VDISNGSAQVSILPFFTRQRIGDAQAQLIFGQLAGSVAAGVRWQSPQVAGSGVLKALGASQERDAVAVFTYVGSSSGTAGYLYAGSATSADFQQLAPAFAQIFASFHVQGQPDNPRSASASQSPTLQYVSWRDPHEGAFSAEIVKGWTAQGGTVRPASDLVQGALDVVSPDHAIEIYFGNAFPVYREPDPLTSAGGYPAGSVILLPDGYRAPIEPLASAQDYLTRVILPGRQLSDLQITGVQDRSDLASRIPTYGGHTRYAAAEVQYQFTRNGQQYRGGALCVIEEVLGTPALWDVWRLSLFEAPVSRYDEAAAAYVHLVQTYRIDPQWAERQSQTELQQAQIWGNAGQAISQLITQGYSQRQATMDQIADREEKAILGEVDVTDPTTGTVYRVDDSPSYYWIDKQGQIVGTSTNSRPGVDFRQLIVNPHQ
jgi:hypothetical protein